MQESQEVHMSNHLDEVVAAVSLTSRKKVPSKLPQTALFQPPLQKLRLCEERAKSYSSSHKYKQAIQQLVRCIALARICYGDTHWKLAEAHVNLAQGYLQLKGLSLQAKQHTEKAKEILAIAIEPSYNTTEVFMCSIELFQTMGTALISLQKFKDASENLAKAERLAKELLQCGRIGKEEWVEIQARIMLSFAQVYQGEKKSKEALLHYQKALQYTEMNKGEKSLECVPVLREIAGVEQALGFHSTAIDHFLQVRYNTMATKAMVNQVLFIKTDAHLITLSRNPSPEEAADSAHFVARAAVASGMPDHHDVAEQYFQESLTHVKEYEGSEIAKFLSIQDEFCNFLQSIGQKEKAIMILRESLEAKVKAFGDFSPEVAETYRILGAADFAQGNHSGAYKKLRKCLEIQTLLYGPQDKRTLATQQSMDILSKTPEVAAKPRQSLKTKVAFCTSVPQHTVLGKARPSVTD
uniref:Tetratricopeptide repeat domain 23 n=1 Tax=Jaculus jaculus TaxID=51337 RepID=A0A8C5LI33_JACJA